jgi:hypothetical protein
MPKKNAQLDVDNIIATNPKINREAFEKGVDALKSLESTGVVKQSTYSLETPDSRRTVKYCFEEGSVKRGSTVRLKER